MLLESAMEVSHFLPLPYLSDSSTEAHHSLPSLTSPHTSHRLYSQLERQQLLPTPATSHPGYQSISPNMTHRRLLDDDAHSIKYQQVADASPLLHDISDTIPNRTEVLRQLQDDEEDPGASLAAWIAGLIFFPLTVFSCYTYVLVIKITHSGPH
jgi:hypothetical protein